MLVTQPIRELFLLLLWLVNRPPSNVPPLRNKGLIAVLIKGNQKVLNKASFLREGGGGTIRGVYRLTSHDANELRQFLYEWPYMYPQ